METYPFGKIARHPQLRIGEVGVKPDFFPNRPPDFHAPRVEVCAFVRQVLAHAGQAVKYGVNVQLEVVVVTAVKVGLLSVKNLEKRSPPRRAGRVGGPLPTVAAQVLEVEVVHVGERKLTLGELGLGQLDHVAAAVGPNRAVKAGSKLSRTDFVTFDEVVVIGVDGYENTPRLGAGREGNQPAKQGEKQTIQHIQGSAWALRQAQRDAAESRWDNGGCRTFSYFGRAKFREGHGAIDFC